MPLTSLFCAASSARLPDIAPFAHHVLLKSKKRSHETNPPENLVVLLLGPTHAVLAGCLDVVSRSFLSESERRLRVVTTNVRAAAFMRFRGAFSRRRVFACCAVGLRATPGHSRSRHH